MHHTKALKPLARCVETERPAGIGLFLKTQYVTAEINRKTVLRHLIF